MFIAFEDYSLSVVQKGSVANHQGLVLLVHFRVDFEELARGEERVIEVPGDVGSRIRVHVTAQGDVLTLDNHAFSNRVISDLWRENHIQVEHATVCASFVCGPAFIRACVLFDSVVQFLRRKEDDVTSNVCWFSASKE